MKPTYLLAIFAATIPWPLRAADSVKTQSFDVRDYGAVGDGKHKDTDAINRAIDLAASQGGGVVKLSPGKFLSGTITLKSHVTLDIQAGATLLASENPDDYPDLSNPFDETVKEIAPLIYSYDAQDITITGRGTIDGQGAIWWKSVAENKAKKKAAAATQTSPAVDPERGSDDPQIHRARPQLIRLVKSTDVRIETIRMINSPSWNIHPLLCERVKIDGVNVTATVPSPNTDGINPEACKTVQISNCRIDVGDDGMTLKSGKDEPGRKMGKPDEDITITNCVVYRAHGGITIGSEMSGGVKNVSVSNCVFHGTENGVRIKSQRGRGGLVEGIAINNIVMEDVPHPFIVTTYYSGNDKPDQTFPVDEGTPKYKGFIFSNITARGATDAGSITGLKEWPIEDITLSNVHVQAAKGFLIRAAKNITFNDVVIDTDAGPALAIIEATDIKTDRLSTNTPHEGVDLVKGSGAANTPAK